MGTEQACGIQEPPRSRQTELLMGCGHHEALARASVRNTPLLVSTSCMWNGHLSSEGPRCTLCRPGAGAL